MQISHNKLLETISYNTETGYFTTKIDRNGKLRAGDRLGYIDKRSGYRSIELNKKKYYEHRLAWFYVHGVWPTSTIDHIDTNRSNNIFSNLREASRTQNLRNQGLRTNNTSGYKGVHINRKLGKYVASIQVNKKNINLGYFDTPEEAAIVYDRAASQYFGEFARTNKMI